MRPPSGLPRGRRPDRHQHQGRALVTPAAPALPALARRPGQPRARPRAARAAASPLTASWRRPPAGAPPATPVPAQPAPRACIGPRRAHAPACALLATMFKARLAALLQRATRARGGPAGRQVCGGCASRRKLSRASTCGAPSASGCRPQGGPPPAASCQGRRCAPRAGLCALTASPHAGPATTGQPASPGPACQHAVHRRANRHGPGDRRARAPAPRRRRPSRAAPTPG
jgi:hypothetical protein